ncbi:unnamed protein product [Scytosiphon promiscuus]
MFHTGPEARFEICSLVGTLSPGGLHLHASLADEGGAVCGGHLVRATVHTTAEIVIGVAAQLTFSREMDSSTGFKELVVTGPDDRLFKIFMICGFLMMAVFMLVVLHLAHGDAEASARAARGRAGCADGNLAACGRDGQPSLP